MDFDDLKKSNDMGVYPPNPNPNPNSIYVNKHFPPPPPPPQPLMQPAGYPMGPYHHPHPQVGYAHPYQGYPSSTPSFKLYSSPSFNRYGHGYGGPWMADENMYSNDEANKFGRLMFATMVTLIIIMCMLSMVIWSLFGTEVPELQVRSFSVSNLTVEDNMIQANWDINVTIVNPNTNMKIHSGAVRVSISYETVPLAVSLVNPFFIEGKEEYNLNFKLDNVSRECEEVLATEILKDKKGGTMFVGLHLGLGAKESPTTLWKRESMKVLCDDLKIDLASDGTGSLSEDSSRECLLDP